MNVPVPKEFEPFVRQVLASGHYRSELDLARTAFKLLQEFEQLRAVMGEDDGLPRGPDADFDLDELEDEAAIADAVEEETVKTRGRRAKSV